MDYYGSVPSADVLPGGAPGSAVPTQPLLPAPSAVDRFGGPVGTAPISTAPASTPTAASSVLRTYRPLIFGGVAAVLAALGVVLFLALTGGDAKLPKEVLGAPKVTGSLQDTLQSEMSAGFEQEGITHVQAAMYGTGSTLPLYFVEAGKVSKSTPDLPATLTANISGAVPTTTTTVDGIPMTCVTAGTDQFAGCIWQGARWMLFTQGPGLNVAEQELVQVKNAMNVS